MRDYSKKIPNTLGDIELFIDTKWTRINDTTLVFANETWCKIEIPIGSGAYSSIFLVVSQEHKEMSFRELYSQHRIMVVKQYESHKELKQFNTGHLAFKRFYREFYPETLKDVTEEGMYCNEYFLMPLFPGDLESIHNAMFDDGDQKQLSKKFSIITSLIIVRACLKAVTAFHNLCKHAHLDIKIDNIQISPTQEIAYLVDFDFIKPIGEKPYELFKRERLFGSRGFFAPEIVDYNTFWYAKETDYFALSAVIIQLLGNGFDSTLKDRSLYSEPYEFITFLQTPYNFDTTHLETLLSENDIDTLKQHVFSLSKQNYKERPESLEAITNYITTLIDKILVEYQQQHKVRYTPVICELSKHRFFSTPVVEAEPEPLFGVPRNVLS